MYGGFFLYLSEIPVDFLRWLKTFTALSVTTFWKTFSLPVYNSDKYVTFFDFPTVITLECTALHYFMIFTAGVLAYPARSFSYKAVGIILGAVSIFSMNILRIGLVGIVGHYSRSMFDFVHLYLWQGTFALIVLLLWISWVSGRAGLSKAFMRYVLFSFVAATISFWSLIALMEYYASLLAFASNVVYSLMSGLVGLKISFVSNGKVIGYASQGGVIYNDISIDVMNSVIFFTLLAITVSPSNVKAFLRRTLAGTLLLFAQHLLFVIIYGIVLTKGMNESRFALFIWITRGLSMAAPLVIWMFVRALFPDDRHQAAIEPQRIE